jgi:hypothetical protein
LSFLKRRISASVTELLIILAIALLFATAYRIWFSRAVTLTQVCERFDTLQNGELADLFSKLEGESAEAVREISRLCQVRRPDRS